MNVLRRRWQGGGAEVRSLALISCTLCQPELIVITSDKTYRFSVPFKVLPRQVGLYPNYHSSQAKGLSKCE